MPQPPTPTCPLTRRQAVDRYILEHRAKVHDVAAYLDRVDRAAADGGGEDHRLVALRDAVAVLIDGKGERARRVLELLSDPTSQPIDKAGGKGASGAWPEYATLAPGV